MIGGTLVRYFGMRFLYAVLAVLAGAMFLVAMIDFLEMLRRTGDMKDVSALLVAKITGFRLLFVTERIIPFAVLVGAMSCYLNLSRRLELVIARSAGMSAWQFIAPAVIVALLIGIAATTIYNPLSAVLRERSVRLESELFNDGGGGNFQGQGGGFWARQRSDEGQAIISAKASRQQGIELGGVSIFRYDEAGHFRDRIEARSAALEQGFWRLDEARIYSSGAPPSELEAYRLKTTLTPAQVRESFATPETVPFWQLSSYIQLAENAGLAAAAYRLQYYQLLVQPLYFASMVLLAAAVSLRFFRFGGVQKMVLGGIAGGFFLYVLAKITGDLSKAGLMPPLMAAALPALLGGGTGVMALLYQEDG
jgi:lipopolysaccharide export system permease protein